MNRNYVVIDYYKGRSRNITKLGLAIIIMINHHEDGNGHGDGSSGMRVIIIIVMDYHKAVRKKDES